MQLAQHAFVAAAHVAGCSDVSLLPSAALGAAKIKIMGGADVTNQTALYPGVTVKPGAVLGVFTYVEAGRTFPRNSTTQVSAAAGLAACAHTPRCKMLLRFRLWQQQAHQLHQQHLRTQQAVLLCHSAC